MKKALLLCALAISLPALPNSAASAQAPPEDSVVGSAVFGLGPDDSAGTLLRFDARSGPSGENPRGTALILACPISLCTALPSWGGDVTCLNVRGNRAIFGYYGPVNNTFYGPVRPRGVVEVIDNGPPSQRSDRVTFNGRNIDIGLSEPDVPFTTCPESIPAGGGGIPPAIPPDSQLSGSPQDFTVTDAKKPRIFTHRQCRLLGWKRIGFISRRQCDNFVDWQCRNGRHSYYGFPNAVNCRVYVNNV
jgi:hypothetical protein